MRPVPKAKRRRHEKWRRKGNEAARLWAEVRNRGFTTAGKDALDGDALLAAQVFVWCAENDVAVTRVAVATTNVSDMTRFADGAGNRLQAATWQEIVPQVAS